MSTLELRDVRAGYGRMEILHDVSLRVDPGEIVSLIGANGAGKTTTLRAIAGTVRTSAGRSALTVTTSPTRDPTSSCAGAWCTSPRTASCSAT